LVGWLVGWLTASTTVVTGCSDHDDGSRHPPSERTSFSQNEVRDGTQDTNNELPFVVSYRTPGAGNCSAVLITPTWVLSAAHCFLGQTNKKGVPNAAAGNTGVFLEEETVVFDSSALPGSETGIIFRHSPQLGASTEETPALLQSIWGQIYPQPRANPIRARKTSAISYFPGYDDSYRDLVLIQLDQRVPTGVLAPIHPPNNSPNNYVPGCEGKNKFTATLVGYGHGSIIASDPWPRWRNFGVSDGWEKESGFPLGSSSSSEYVYKNTWAIHPYAGMLPGDSGGAFIDLDFNVPGAYPYRLCGTNSSFAPVGLSFLFPNYTRVTPVDSPANRQFLLNQRVIDQDGRFMGECLPSELTGTADDDTDSDFDLIPNACDPCRFVPDPEYRFTGAFSLTDVDGDGIPDACDNCPRTNSSNRNDSDGDGLGDACDTAVSAGFDLSCCTSDAECPGTGNQCVPFGTWIPGAAPSSPGAAYCFNRGESRCAKPLDSDLDGISDRVDNCPLDKNKEQYDFDGDGIGEACDKCKYTSFDKRVRDDQLFIDTNLVTREYFDCNPILQGDLSGKAADQFCFLKNQNIRSKCVRTQLSPLGGRCTEGPDLDGDGVGDACDNCKNVANKFQENCNLEMEVAMNQVALQGTSPDLSAIRGDACDPIPCAKVKRSLYSSPQTPPAGMLVEVSPILLPTSSPDAAFTFTSTNPPSANVGLRFCTCGNRDGATRDPLQCAGPTSGGCEVDGTLFNNVATGNPWLAPSFREVGNPNTPWDSTVIPTGNGVPVSRVNNVPFSNAFPKKYASFLPDDAPPGFAQWETDRWDNPPPGIVGLLATPGKEVCTDRLGVQGVVWSSIRAANNLIAPPPSFPIPPLGAGSSHYAYDQWGDDGTCGPNPGNVTVPPPKQLCYFCPDPSLGLPELLLYKNPNPEDVWTFFATDGYKFSPVLDVPDNLGGLWAQPDTRWLTASDATSRAVVSRRDPGSFVLLAWQSTTRKVTAGFGFERGTFVPLSVRGGPRALEESGESSLSVGAEPPVTPQGVEPSPRQEPGVVLSSRENTLFMVSGAVGNSFSRDLWAYELSSGQWTEIPLKGAAPEKPLAVTYHEPSRALYVTDEIKQVGLRLGRLLRIDPNTGATVVLGWWPRSQTFDRQFLSVGSEGELVISASSSKGKGHHVVVVFEENNGQLKIRWGLAGAGSLDGAPALTEEGLTRPFESPSLLSKRFTPTNQLPKKGGPVLGGCF
jgi:hypothetical protein